MHLMYHMLNKHVMFALLLSIFHMLFRSIPFRSSKPFPKVNSPLTLFLFALYLSLSSFLVFSVLFTLFFCLYILFGRFCLTPSFNCCSCMYILKWYCCYFYVVVNLPIFMWQNETTKNSGTHVFDGVNFFSTE